jgi:NADH-quinone oxidoreductase subunit D
VHPMFARIGGIAHPFTPACIAKVREVVARTRAELNRISDAASAYAHAHTGIAILAHDNAVSFGATGPVGRASGAGIDLRLQQPYLSYGELAEFLPRSSPDTGDLEARYGALVAEIAPSLAMIEVCADRVLSLGDAPVSVSLPKVVKAPEGTYYGQIDSPTGVSGYLLVSTAEKAPWRFKLRTPSFAHAQALTSALVGCPVDQLEGALMSFFLVTGDIDR